MPGMCTAQFRNIADVSLCQICLTLCDIMRVENHCNFTFFIAIFPCPYFFLYTKRGKFFIIWINTDYKLFRFFSFSSPVL